MPILPPRLRMRLKSPLALPIWSCASVPMLEVASGTKIRLIAIPLRMVGQTMLLMPMLRLMFPKRNDE